MAHGHNGYLDTILNSGVIGFTLYVLLITKVLRSCGGNLGVQNVSLSWFYISMIFLIVCSNLMESVILLSEEAENIVFLLVGFLAVAPGGETASERVPILSAAQLKPATEARR